MPKYDKKQDGEKKAMTASEIRDMREEEMLDSVYREKTQQEKHVENGIIWGVTLIVTAVLVVGLHYLGVLESIISEFLLPFLWMVDDSSGFLAEFFAKLLELALILFVTVSFGFALNINYSSKGRPKETWKKLVGYATLAAFGIDVLYLVLSRIFSGPFTPPVGGIFSQVMYYITKLLIVPFAHVMLYLVVPSAIIKMILTLISHTREQTELPLTVAGSVILALGMLGMTWSDVKSAGFLIIFYVIVQAAAYSIIYHRTDTIWRPVLLYSGVTGTYYILAWLLSLI